MKRLLCFLFGHRWIPSIPPHLKAGQLYMYQIITGHRWKERATSEPGEFRPVCCGRCGKTALQYGRMVP